MGYESGVKQRLGYIAAFVAGIALTIGVYETVRIVTNARQALSAASSQLSEQSGPAPRTATPSVAPSGRRPIAKKSDARSPIERQLEELADDPRLPPEDRTAMAKKRAVIQKGISKGGPSERRARRQAQRKERLASMTSEERAAARERRRQRRMRNQAPGAPPPSPPPIEERDPVDDQPEGDEPFVDTGTP